MKPEDYGQMARVLRERHIGYVLYNGGNGSMDACGKLARACAGAGICVVGIPKTIDNDLAVTDHAPGFGSAARYLAATVREVSEDVRSLPIHACVIEAMGRNAGWLAAASALARSGEMCIRDRPKTFTRAAVHLCLKEREYPGTVSSALAELSHQAEVP